VFAFIVIFILLMLFVWTCKKQRSQQVEGAHHLRALAPVSTVAVAALVRHVAGGTS